MSGIQNKLLVKAIYKLLSKGYSGNQFLSGSQILMFHNIIPKENINEGHNDYSTTEKRFIDIIKWYKNHDYEFISLDELCKRIEDNSLTDKEAVITFDDGFESAYSVVLPILNEFRIPFIAYITSDYINTPDYLSEIQLKLLSDNNLCTIGCHTKSHPMTRYLLKREIIFECKTSKETIERIIQKKIEHFAFPYGSFYACSCSDAAIIKSTHLFKSISTTRRKNINKNSDINFLPRIDASKCSWIDCNN